VPREFEVHASNNSIARNKPAQQTRERGQRFERARIEALFNRGIVASQWVTRRLGLDDNDAAKAKRLDKVIDTPGDPFRDYLA
jgi:hypothetical protein